MIVLGKIARPNLPEAASLGVFLSKSKLPMQIAAPRFIMSTTVRKPFPFREFEPFWQSRWDQEKTFRTPGPGEEGFDAAKPKFYVLDMFPYPSGAGLHVGHPLGYTATDIIGRYRKMNGFNVLHPMGYDSFGLPAEQYAIKTGQHPAITTAQNIETYRRQLKALGFGYDWDREIATTDPEYVRWTQWIFLQIYQSYFCEETQRARPVSELLEKGWTREQIDDVRLAYVADTPVWWSPDLGTVLANEEVEEWKAKGHQVERRPLRQWMLRITKYAQRLIDELDTLDWPEGIKLLQKNWIGRSEGASVQFDISDHPFQIEVFTTRPDTLFGATYMVLAPEHPFVPQITTAGQQEAVAIYQKSCSAKSDLDRGDLNKDKSGVFTGAYAINPVNGEQLPIWIADYVMMSYGTGAIMAVPAHDERDFEFASKFSLPIKTVVTRSVGVSPTSSPYFNPEKEIQKHVTFELPHWQQKGKLIFATWRLADSIPQEKLNQWRAERDAWTAIHPEPWDTDTENEYHQRFSKSIDEWLDSGSGECILQNSSISKIVADAMHHFDGDRYFLESFVIMPNHVHVLFRLSPDHLLEDVIHSWKSFSAKEINKARSTSGEVWQKDYWDRIVRDRDHHDHLQTYIAENPKRARLKEGAFVHWSRSVGVSPTHDEDVGGTPTLLDGPGIAVNSGFLDGLATADAKREMIAWLEAKQLGKCRVQYKLRDWLFSRQRYWGEPFPLVWKNGQHHGLAESELPLLAPPLEDYKPTGTPDPILSKAREWVELADGSARETNTMPQWAGSCWYYLRYCDPSHKNRFISREAETYWSGGSEEKSGMVDLYVGGTEHAVLHLLYARFWHKVLFDLGEVSTPEPFQKLINQGLILGEDGQKMSKSRGNVVNPDDVIREYGADALRLYEMFMGPLEQVKPWQMKGVEGVSRFLARVWRLAFEEKEDGSWAISQKVQDVPCSDLTLRRVVHETIKKVSEDIEKLSFNTAISQMMICTNAFTQATVVPRAEFFILLQLLNPFAPHLTEEIHAKLGGNGMLCEGSWPQYDEAALVKSEVELVIQVNGKLRDRIVVPLDLEQPAIEEIAFASPKISEHLAGKTLRKVIFIPGKILNIVAN
ncbi:MAG: leucine--tRNA ligase [Verrucomicrobia bacterium]|nr:MAG: leucine--tRNA ligase [Verrucomicrobiota bacterium]